MEELKTFVEFNHRKKKIVVYNLTPHDVHYEGSGVEKMTFPRQETGVSARLVEDVYDINTSSVEIFKTACVRRGKADNLPEPQTTSDKNVYFIVSDMIRTSFPNRADLLSPGKLLRNKNGVIIGTSCFYRNDVNENK